MSSPRITVVLLSAFLALGCGLHCYALSATMDSGHACCPGENDDPQVSAEADCEPAGATFALDVDLPPMEVAFIEPLDELSSVWFAEPPARPPDILRQTSVLLL